jgi:hypothetical protein
MSKKKINFSKKPNSIEDSKIIDDWVLAGDNNLQQTHSIIEKRFTIVIPEDLYRNLKVKCAKNDLKLKDFIINALEKNLIN